MTKIKNLLIIISAIVIVSLGNGCKNNTSVDEHKEPSRDIYKAEIGRLEKEMHEAKEMNMAKADSAIKAYADYSVFFPKDSITADYLFKAGELATAAKHYDKALIYYQTITKDYPNYKLSAESLYLQGFLYDNYLNQDGKAKEIYEQVIEKYPNHALANDSKAAINNLGKTDEELIQEFKKKNGEK